MNRRRVYVVLLAIILIGLGTYLLWYFLVRPSAAPVYDTPGAEPGNGQPEVVAQDLVVPWEIAFLPDGDMLVTERPGRLRRIGRSPVVFNIAGVRAQGEGGLLGLALHPGFATNGLIYIYFTTASAGSPENRVERYRLSGNRLTERRLITGGIPAAGVHNGGRIAFGPDRLLYITTGDAQNPSSAQSTRSAAGKILRVRDDGGIPGDNPFGNRIYSYGHRNPQGLAWDSRGRLWATEHGSSAFDEVNLIRKGGNYGWPLIRGNETRQGMISPVINSGPNATWAPAGMAFMDGKLFFGGLRGAALFEADIRDGSLALSRHLQGRFGRIRAVVADRDGMLYISTSNRDGRGQIRLGDDKIIRVNPSGL
ncbi:MAG: PQQ-dependent sugar dehydrogenase [bacterium]|nr:PQQ-dependent sugar dehydrogenase [bacterium]